MSSITHAHIGLMADRVTLQRPAEAVSSTGAVTLTWTTLGEVWADVREETPRERVRSGRVESRQAITVRMRYRPDLVPQASDRLVWRGRTYEVTGPPTGGRRERYWTLLATEVA